MTSPSPVELALDQILARAGDLYLYNALKYTQAAAVACYVLEAVDTLHDEIRYLWPSPWGVMKVTYLVNKYLPLLDIVFLVLVTVSHDPHPCGVRYQLRTYCFLVGTLFSEYILIARTYALWGCSKLIIYYTIFAAAMMVPHSFYVVSDMLRFNMALFAEPENGPRVRVFGCLPVINNTSCWPAFVYLIGAELMVVVMTLLKRYCNPVVHTGGRTYSSVLLCTMYRDGTWFWAILLVITVVNLFMMFFAPNELKFSTHQFVRTVHSALCTRVLLNLRKASESASNSGSHEFTVATLGLESLPMFAAGGDEDLEGEGPMQYDGFYSS